MKHPIRAILFSLLGTLALAQSTPAAELLTNGNFTTVSYTGSLPVTTIFGQFGTGSGSNITVAGWNTTGYNFLFTPDTADAGTQNGANPAAGTTPAAPNEAPSRFNTNSGYGSTYLWGTKNGGLNTFTASPAGGNFIAADADYGRGAVTQTVNNLTVGGKYQVSFFWAAAQQQSFDGMNQESWTVSLDSQAFTTPTITLPSHGFSGWVSQVFTYTATSTSETLSFLANNGSTVPAGQPPFVLLSGVSMVAVPEPTTWMAFIGLGAALTVVGVIRRRRRAAFADGLNA